MMLALYDAHSRDRPYSLKQLYDAAGVNNATAARWLGILVQRGLMLRTPDAVDGRKHWAILTELGVAAMEDCLLVESDLFNTALAGPGLSVSQNGPDTVRPKSVRRRD
ncbi:MarR family transcriptional regulator [Novosphingobium sp. TW-4]|uniref:MarR family transcriptional regulator n=2 Tax=Novosphingobium olei TaxID=2728851 RepID=A0A7Y0BSS1_9SPHN|nr:MarR family transcriptional regulator [Novosphingobium olei]